MLLTIQEKMGNRDLGLPIPPPLLRYRVHGALDKASFLATGKKCAEDIKSILRNEGYDLYAFSNILDFACGCGRVIRHFQGRPDSVQLWGTDIDAVAIGWCRNSLPKLANWDVNGFAPPTSYETGKFNYINVTSLFTHLNESDQLVWLAELRRICIPNGLLLLTVHGEYAQQALSDQEKAELEHSGFLYKTGLTGRVKLDGLPDAYQTAFHTKSYIQDEWGKYFSIVRHIERGINDYQDAVLLINDKTG